jgi:uncharacterized membrane protein YfhO
LADTFYPGWNATLDSKPVTIFKINGFFRGVFVPAGTHQIEFLYQPTSFYLGIAAAAATLLVYGGFLIGINRRSMPTLKLR